ncbi:MAG: Asp23/Gls24 family envelope stress response protein [Defluviitaleaceae bacterium]|nr:Asp23/Gls24 family envelope stress response protein [Defluviitaleaceae bacterium]
MAEIKAAKGFGTITISEDVIAIIAGTAAMEIEGVLGTGHNLKDIKEVGGIKSIKGGIAEILGYKSLSKGVKVEVFDGDAKIEVNISTEFGAKIHEIAENVQQNVKNAVETMTGLNVLVVNVNVASVHIGKEDEPATDRRD